MESYQSLSNANAKLNYGPNNNNNNNNGTDVGTGTERKMTLSRSLTQPQGTSEYMVRDRDTIASVAAKFQTTPSELARINKIIGRFIFPGQTLYVPKRNQDSEKGNSGSSSNNNNDDDVPPNTPNESRTSSNSDSVPDSPLPGHAKRIINNPSLFPLNNKEFQHGQLHQTSSSPISTFESSSSNPINSTLTEVADNTGKAIVQPVQQIDPADRECLERFLKIGVRHITDGQGVVTGVLLITPNALMFDPNVSDPLVIEHGPELYGVTIPMDSVLKSAIYTDIAHMRVKHAPEMMPTVPKPAVYYASDDDAANIFEENIASVYAKKSPAQFDTIITEQAEEDEIAETTKKDETLLKEQNIADLNVKSSSQTELSNEEDTFEDAQESVSEDKSENIERLSNERRMEEEISIDLTETSDIGSFDQNRSDFINVSTDEERLCPDLLGTSPQQSNRLSSYFQSKLALSERHSAPLSGADQRTTPPPLVSAVSAEESNDFTSNKRRSASGESKREQMLKRFSNPVDAIGSITKSGINSGINVTKTGFNATKTGISTGLNATKSGINTGIMATKTGLTSGLNATKTGFNKVLSTPKNLMDFSSGLVRDAKGALGTGSKSDNDLSDKAKSEMESNFGYMNMVDTKIDALENFDKLIPKPARHSKDPPLYLCIRMGKHKKTLKKDQRFSPTYSFGKKKYEREYWFSVPKDKAKSLYHFFKKWAPEVYGDVDDLKGCEERGLEPITTDDELECDDEPEDESTSKDGTEKSSDDKENDSQKLNVNKTKFWRRRSPLNFLKLVEDHFSTEGMANDWNISNSSEEYSFAERFGAEPSEPILPDINGQTELLTVDIIRNLSKHLPARAEGYAWTLIYSTSIHGFSLNTLYREMKHVDTPVLFIIEDTFGAKFGSLLSTTLQPSDHFYGTGETFLFTFYPDFACYPWTGENLFFIKGNADSFSVGAGEGNFGLWLDGDLYHGSSHPCKTFGNTTLSSGEDFVVKSIECWGFF
ncbi:hypothetical protein RDWZM_001911 [Blomia tropicalis]|uniref:Oxidation resistance protein 1 n=1 Tax=Blomia tropicalis TaxID=40697 RepID=A0A9Q0MCI5_BLOTA|nr:hypothetical protein RDWZM_001911 [Blomia tropicalis]